MKKETYPSKKAMKTHEMGESKAKKMKEKKAGMFDSVEKKRAKK